MKMSILTVNRIEGFHRSPDPPKYLAYLEDRHRHTFTVECGFDTRHDGIAVDNVSMQHQVAAYFRDTYGDPAEFGDRSCFEIARELLKFYPHCQHVVVREDGDGGGAAYRGCL